MKKLNLTDKTPFTFKGSANNALKDFTKRVDSYKKKNGITIKPKIKAVGAVSHSDDKFVTYVADLGDVKIEADYQSGKSLKEEDDTMEDNIRTDLEDVLYTRAYERLEQETDNMKDSFLDRQAKIDEVLRVRKFHAKGGSTKHKRAKNQGEKTKLTGKSKAGLRQQGIKLKKTLRKQTGGKKRIKQMKQAKALKKRGSK